MDTMRYCADIGMYAIDRPIMQSCVHASDFCKANCFNSKLYRMYSAMHTKDARNETAWQTLNGSDVAATLQRKRRQTSRVRLMTRGEALRDMRDVARIIELCAATPKTTWWLPTRAWRNPVLRLVVERELFGVANLRILASTDPTTTQDEQESLDVSGWSTMFFGDNSALETLTGGKRFKCPKTWGHAKGACAVCKRGCFRTDQPVHVHLKRH